MVSRGRALLVAVSIAVLFLIASAAASAASSPGVEWEKTYDVQGNDHGWSMQQASDGGYIMAGTSNGLVCLAKVDANGSVQWKNTYSFGDSAKGYGVCQASDGAYIVTGSVRQGGKDKVLLMKAGQNGTQLWNKTYGDSNAGSVEGAGTSVREISGGYVIAAQYPYPTTGNCGLYLIMADTNGNMIRNIMIGKGGDITSPSVEQTSDGGFIVAATLHTKGYQGIEPDYDIYLIKFDPSGSTQWEKTIGGTGSQYSGHDGSVKQASGGYVIAGENGGAYLAKVDGQGNLLWSKQYNDSSRANSVAVADDGGFVIEGVDGSGKLLIIKTNSSGDEEWRQAAGAGACDAASVQKADDGGYAASGSSGGDLYLVKLKAPVKTSSSLSMGNGLFSGFDLFKLGMADDSSTDLGQVKAGNSLFGPSAFKMFNPFGDDSSQYQAQASSPFKFSMPSFGNKASVPGINTSFPKLTASFGNGGWPFS